MSRINFMLSRVEHEICFYKHEVRWNIPVSSETKQFGGRGGGA